MAAMELTPDIVDLLRSGAVCHVATSMPDGSPQLTTTWVDTDGTHVVVNSVDTHQKVRNLRRDPRVALTVSRPDNPFGYVGLRGRVIDITTEGAADHIDELAQRYTGKPYAWYGGRDQVRVRMVIEVERIHRMG
jgi:PPOX class probable F420-dependent enzyme